MKIDEARHQIDESSQKIDVAMRQMRIVAIVISAALIVTGVVFIGIIVLVLTH